MIPVKTYPKFKCDFCKKRAVAWVMKKHEIICWYNPNRVCEHRYADEYEGACRDCGIADEIKREKEKKQKNEVEPIDFNDDLPF